MRDYTKMNKEAKVKAKKEFLEKGDTTLYGKANRIVILCIMGMILGLGSTIFDYVYHAQVLSYILDGLLLLFSILMLIRMQSIKKTIINNYLNKKKK